MGVIEQETRVSTSELNQYAQMRNASLYSKLRIGGEVVKPIV